MKCEDCKEPTIECLKTFEIQAYINTDLSPTDIGVVKQSSIDTGIRWARSIGADFIEVYQGCDKENRVLILQLKRG